MVEPPAAPADGVGARLQSGRERLGLTVVQAAERLRLEPQAVLAMEAGRFDALGPSVYARGHLRRYAGLLGENAAELEALYVRRPGALEAPEITRSTLQQPLLSARRAPRKLGLWPIVLIAVLLLVAALAWWIFSAPAPVGVTTETIPLSDATGTP